MTKLFHTLGMKGAEFIIGSGIAYVQYQAGEDLLSSILMGLLPVTLIELVQLNLYLSKVEQFPDQLQTVTATIADISGEWELQLAALELSGKPELSHREVWTTLTKLLRRKYVATNYIDMNKIYGHGGGEQIVALQVALHETRQVDFEKVFFHDGEAEPASENFKKYVALHRTSAGGGISVRRMDRSMLRSTNYAANVARIGGLGRTDFAVFDDMVVLIWKLNATRDVESWELVVGKKNAQPFIDMFNTLHMASTPC